MREAGRPASIIVAAADLADARARRSPFCAGVLALAELGLDPILDLRMGLGEGTGATVALPILRAAVAALSSMATFTEAGVSTRYPTGSP